MAHRKYYGYKPKYEYYSVVLFEKEGEVGQLLNFVYANGRCGMNHYYWGSDMDYERNRDGEVEHNFIWDEENTKKMMLRTGTKNGKDLVKAIYERFHAYGTFASNRIEDWCKKKNIEYDFRAWF